MRDRFECVRRGALCVALLVSTAVPGADFFVDPVNGADGAGRGTSEATAFRTIQAAVDAAAVNDTGGASVGIRAFDHSPGFLLLFR